MKRLHVISALGLITCLMIGCGGGGAKITCPIRERTKRFPALTSSGSPDAEEGNVCLTRTPVRRIPRSWASTSTTTSAPPASRSSSSGPRGRRGHFQAHGVTKRTIEWGVAVDPGRSPDWASRPTSAPWSTSSTSTRGRAKPPACTPGVICDPSDTRTIPHPRWGADAAAVDVQRPRHLAAPDGRLRRALPRLRPDAHRDPAASPSPRNSPGRTEPGRATHGVSAGWMCAWPRDSGRGGRPKSGGVRGPALRARGPSAQPVPTSSRRRLRRALRPHARRLAHPEWDSRQASPTTSVLLHPIPT